MRIRRFAGLLRSTLLALAVVVSAGVAAVGAALMLITSRRPGTRPGEPDTAAAQTGLETWEWEGGAVTRK